MTNAENYWAERIGNMLIDSRIMEGRGPLFDVPPSENERTWEDWKQETLQDIAREKMTIASCDEQIEKIEKKNDQWLYNAYTDIKAKAEKELERLQGLLRSIQKNIDLNNRWN